MDGSTRLETPGKLNLFLEIKGIRPDSYHEIETLFYPVRRVNDTITIIPEDAPGIRISCDAQGVPEDESNLCWKAADRYCRSAGIVPSFSITLKKGIPVAAGMGGGSSDAAAVLRLLQKHFHALDDSTLLEIAVKTGADVPFFLNPVPSAGRGIGEILTPLDGIPEQLPILIAAPLFPISAPWAYRHRNRPAASADTRALEPLTDALRKADFPRAASLLRNDLEYAVLEKFPLLEILKRTFSTLRCRVLVSGSGPTLFLFFESFEARENACEFCASVGETYALQLFQT